MTRSKALRASSRAPEFGGATRCGRSTGISTPLGWPERAEAYLEGACELFVDAAKRALDEAGLAAADVDTIVTISSTGIATPSLEARVAGRLGFRPDVERVPVFGLGCAGGVSGFSIASRLACSRPGSIVLMVAVEVCTLAFRLDELTKANIVATALFGDGAAACVLRAYDGGVRRRRDERPAHLARHARHHGLENRSARFRRHIRPGHPAFRATAYCAGDRRHLGRAGLALEDVDRFACHPGGAKVITALERALSLEQGSLDHERAVLADYGNMSAPTVLFVLERIIRCRPAVAHIADRDGARFHCELRFPEESRVTPAALLLGAVTAERIAELFLARRNTAALLAKGAVEFAPGHYPAIVLMHALWLASLWIFGATRTVNPIWLAVFLALQVLRVWI